MDDLINGMKDQIFLQVAWNLPVHKNNFLPRLLKFSTPITKEKKKRAREREVNCQGLFFLLWVMSLTYTWGGERRRGTRVSRRGCLSESQECLDRGRLAVSLVPL